MYVIRYESQSTVNSEPVGTVYVRRMERSVTGGRDVHSYTRNVDEATRYETKHDALHAITVHKWNAAQPVWVRA